MTEKRSQCPVIPALFCLFVISTGRADDELPESDPRPPATEADLQYWLTNMFSHHGFSLAEAAAATGLSDDALAEKCERLDIEPGTVLPVPDDEQVFVLPYPGGRHPRIGFLEGAIRPQRETKVSVFTPWQPEDRSRADYVVADVPEAVWSNLGLTYLAHTHVPTIWTEQDVTLEPLEWDRRDEGAYHHRRELPNGIAFTSDVNPRDDHVDFTMTLTNGTDAPLTGLRVQNCVMLREAAGFNQQTLDNKVMRDPYIACHDESKTRWIITAWKPNHRTWGNVRCPCLHSDPIFDDCPPGETKTVRGWLSFYEGEDLDGEIERIEGLEWWERE